MTSFFPRLAAVRKAPRWNSLFRFFATSLAGRGVGISCQLLQVPLAIHALGTEAFGFWMAVSSFTALATFADFGIGLGVQNQMAAAFGKDDRATARTLFCGAFTFLLVVASLIALIAALFTGLLDLPRLFHLKDLQAASGARTAVLAVLLTFCAGFPFGLAQRLAYSMQAGWKHNIAQACANVFSLAGVFIAACLHLGLPSMIIAASFPAVVANAVLLVHLFLGLSWPLREAVSSNTSTVRGLLNLGLHFFVQQILGTIVFALPQMIISTTLGAAAVTPFNLTQRFFNLFSVIQNAFMLPLWPAYSEAHARGEFPWIRTTLRKSLVATALACILPMAIGAFFARDVIFLWVKSGPALPTTGLVALLFLWNAAVCLQQPFVFLLAGVSKVQRMTLYSLLGAGTGALLMLLLVGPMGRAGVALGLLLGSVPFTVLGNMISVRGYLRGIAPAESELSPTL